MDFYKLQKLFMVCKIVELVFIRNGDSIPIFWQAAFKSNPDFYTFRHANDIKISSKSWFPFKVFTLLLFEIPKFWIFCYATFFNCMNANDLWFTFCISTLSLIIKVQLKKGNLTQLLPLLQKLSTRNFSRQKDKKMWNMAHLYADLASDLDCTWHTVLSFLTDICLMITSYETLIINANSTLKFHDKVQKYS